MQATVENLNKARDAQHEYLQGRILTPKDTIDKITCPCGGAIKWWGIGRLDSGETGKCAKKCGHEFIYLEQEIEDNHATDENNDPVIHTIGTVYCRRKMNGDYLCHIGELVTWWKSKTPEGGHQLNMPMDSPFWDWAEYTGHDAVFLVIGIELSGDRVLVARTPADGDGDWKTFNDVEAKDVTETMNYSSIGCFWVPIEYLESVSEWPYIDENA